MPLSMIRPNRHALLLNFYFPKCFNDSLNRFIHIKLSKKNGLPTHKIVFSAIQPTGIPHLGNFLGAMLNWVKLQNSEHPDTRLIFSVADLHALTTLQDSDSLRNLRMQTLASMLAVGLNEERCTIFMQSELEMVTELMWILNCTASMGYLSRMTQWKSKTGLKILPTTDNSINSARIKLGLFSYPVLQAADILIHNATHVPVGADQSQHLEFARECVTNFNSTYSPILVKPETILSPSMRIRSLVDPDTKMSKSSGTKNSRILITDTKHEIKKKLLSAVTDSENRVSWDPETRPGVSNLVSILSALDSSGRTPQQLAVQMNDCSLGELKNIIAEKIDESLQPVRERYNQLIADQDHLDKVAARGREKAHLSGNLTMRAIRKVIGLS